MKSITNIFFLLGFALFMGSCSDDDPEFGDLDMNIKLEYDGSPLVMFDNYTYPSGESFYVTKVSMYMSDIALDTQRLSDVEFFNFSESHSNATAAAAGFSHKFTNIPADDYPNFNFGLGVNAANNAKEPGEFTSDNPLSNSGEYWPAWSSFVFYKIEGMLDSDGDGSVDTGISLHMGGDEVYTILTYDKPITISEDETASVTLTLDLEKVFNNNGVIYDIVSNPGLHNKTNHLVHMQTLMTNTVSTMTLQ